jgi:NAD(P)-dependent dehydrogenase (short-subunit alcohol dehydrogenase family)
MKKLLLNKKSIFILGGNGLLGLEIVKLFSNNARKIVILDINKKRNNNKKVFFHKFDSSDLDHVEKNLSHIIKKFGCPEVFINCSYPATDDWAENTFLNAKIESVKKNIEIHQVSYCWIAKVIAETMKKFKKKGSIVQFGSIYGILAQNPNLYENTNMKENFAYPIIKGGITNFTKQLASFYGKYKIRINTICLGGVKGHIKNNKKRQSKNFIKKYSSHTPLRRLALPEDAAYAAYFLSSDASDYITGSNLMVDGGYSII